VLSSRFGVVVDFLLIHILSSTSFFGTKMGQTLLSTAILALGVASVTAQTIQYVTDMPAYSALVRSPPRNP
jgi:hypothetical protein